MRPLRAHPGTARLSDVERERALRTLKAHFADGRLSVAEFESRVEDVYRSGTRGEIWLHLRDLPLRGARQLIIARLRRLQRAVLRMHALTYATLNITFLGIWALTGQGVFWPAWLLLPSTALLAWHVVVSRKLTRALGQRRP